MLKRTSHMAINGEKPRRQIYCRRFKKPRRTGDEEMEDSRRDWLLREAQQHVVVRLDLEFMGSRQTPNYMTANLVSRVDPSSASGLLVVRYSVREGSSQSALKVQTTSHASLEQEWSAGLIEEWATNFMFWAKPERIVCTQHRSAHPEVEVAASNVWMLQALNRLLGAVGEYRHKDGGGVVNKVEHQLAGILADANARFVRTFSSIM